MGNNNSAPSSPNYDVTDMSKAEFELFLGFFDTIGDKYKQGLEKYVKQLDDKTHVPTAEETNNFNAANTIIQSSTSTAEEKAEAQKVVTKYNQYTSDRGTYAWYAPIKQSIPNLYSILKGTLARKSIWIPSIQWINYGITLPDNAEYSINLGYEGGDITTTAVGKIMDLQHHFETEVFAPTLASLKNQYKRKVDVYIARKTAQVNAVNDPVKLHAEYERQKTEGVKLHVQKSDKKGYETINVATAYPNNYDAWLGKFRESKEWKEYLGAQSKQIEKDYAKELKDAETARQASLSSGTFHMGNIFEDQDQDSINYDVIQKLKEQEAEFNQLLATAKAELDASLAANQVKLNEDLEKLKTRLATEQQGIFDKLDGAIKKNEENAVKRQNQQNRKDKENEDIIDEQRALASLKNYTSCSSSSNQERANRVRDEVYEDEDIEALIDAQTQRILTGQGKKRKKMSISQQMMLLNKRFIEHNGEGSPHIKTNSARKRLVGGDDMSPLEIAATTFDVAGAVFPPLAIIGAILSVVNIFDAKAREEAEARRIAEEQRQERLFDAWKDDTIATTVSTLEAETDEDVFEQRKIEMINNMFETSKGEITQEDLDDLIQDIDEAHERTMSQRKDILDQITTNAEDVVNEGQDLLDNYNDSMEKQLEENDTKRDDLMKPFVEALSAKAEQYKVKDEARADIAKKEQEYKDKVNERLMEEYGKIDEEQDEIKQLKGYSGCSSNAVNLDAIKHQVREDIARQAALAEEAKAQGVTPEQLPSNTSTVGTGGGNIFGRPRRVVPLPPPPPPPLRLISLANLIALRHQNPGPPPRGHVGPYTNDQWAFDNGYQIIPPPPPGGPPLPPPPPPPGAFPPGHVGNQNPGNPPGYVEDNPREPTTDPRTPTGGGKTSRAQIVKQVMIEKGMKMIEASKYVKQKGLYKK